MKIKIKTVITSIQSVWVTRATRSDLAAIRANLAELGTNFAVLRPLGDNTNMN